MNCLRRSGRRRAGLTAHQAAHPPLVISQFQLGREFRPDFVFFWMNFSGEFIQLIEIESPKLLAFNASDEFSYKFNHAVQQVRDWPDWILRNGDLFEQAMLPLFERGWITGIPSFTRSRGVDVDADSLYEAVAIAVAQLREDEVGPADPNPNTEFTVMVYRQPTEHRLLLKQVLKWAEPTTKDGPVGITKRQRVRALLAILGFRSAT